MSKYGNVKCYRIDDDTLKLLACNLERQNGKSNKKKMTEAAYIRDLIHRDYQNSLGFSSDDFTKISRILAGIGNNINQIAHNTNMQVFNSYDVQQLNDGLQTIYDMKKLLAEIRKRV